MPHAETQTDSRSPLTAVQSEDQLRNRRYFALGMLAVAALFSGLVIGVMVTAHFAEEGDPPPESPTMQELGVLLQKYPGSNEIKEAIRREDQRLRNDYFTRRRLMSAGAFLLLGGLAAAVICARWYAALDKRTPMPSVLSERTGEDKWLAMRRRSLVAVGALAGSLVVALLIMSFVGGGAFPRGELTEPPTTPAQPEQAAGPVAEALPPEGGDAGFKGNWPRFRGPTGMGIVDAGDWPLNWDAGTGENILWKTAVPVPGKSSPVVWGNRIFLTGADAKTQEILCFERAGGKLLWRKAVGTAAEAGADGDEGHQVHIMDDTGYAAPTPVTDGERVCAFFATADLATLDLDGQVLWVKNLGDPENTYGIATSPIIHNGKIIIKFDRGTMAEDELSALLALDAKTGEELWRVGRPVPGSWSTPLVVQTGSGPELITCGNPWVIAYDPEFGTELWRADLLSGDVAPSPVFSNEVAFVTNDYARVAAVRIGGIGDVTATHIAWTADQGMSDASSPVCDDDFFLQAQSSGWVTCYDAKEGKLLWEHQFDSAFWASPTLVGRNVYLPGDDGKTYLFGLSDRLELIGTADVGEPVHATPAFADLRIYIRGEKHLFCIGREQGSSATADVLKTDSGGEQGL